MLQLANYFGIDEKIKEYLEEKNAVVTLDLDGKKEIKIPRFLLTKAYPTTNLVDFFVKNMPHWIVAESPNHYYIARPDEWACEMAFNFLKSKQIEVEHDQRKRIVTELLAFGIKGHERGGSEDNDHYYYYYEYEKTLFKFFE